MRKRSSSDRISNLPEALRHHILSFLSTSDAIRTSILSSTWRYVWICLPFLDFGKNFWKNSKYSKPIDNHLHSHRLYHDIYLNFNNGEEGNLIDYADSSLRTGVLGFVLFIDQIVRILKNHPRNQTRKLRLFLPNDAGWGDDGVSMDIAFTNADELQGLSDLIQENGRDYRFKLSSYLIASSNSLIELNLRVFRIFNLHQSVERMPIKLLLVRKLSMKSSRIEIDQGVVEYLLRSCSTLLEELSLRSFNSNSRLLEVYGFPKLRVLQVRIHNLESLKINAPDLHSLSLGYLPKQCSVNWTSFRNLVKLKLDQCCCITNNFFDDGLAKFARLESLHISMCFGLTHIKVWLNSLTNLVISSCCDLTQIEIDTPNLKSFSLYTGVIVSLFCKSTTAPQNAFLFLTRYSRCITKNTKWLKKFSRRQTSAFYGPGNEGMISSQELRESSSPLLWRVQRLHVFLNFILLPTKHNFLQYMDVVLQLSSRSKTFVLSTTKQVEQDNDWNLVGHEDHLGHLKIELEFQYKEEIGEVENSCGCYPRQPINCWRHSLTNFKIKKQEGARVPNVKKFFEDVLAESYNTFCGASGGNGTITRACLIRRKLDDYLYLARFD